MRSSHSALLLPRMSRYTFTFGSVPEGRMIKLLPSLSSKYRTFEPQNGVLPTTPSPATWMLPSR